MKKRSAQIDDYIAKAPKYARPILIKLRSLFHKACPQIEETLKWRFPHFEHKGIVGSMAAFKNYVSYGFWKGKLMSDPAGLFEAVGETGMCGTQVARLRDLPPDKLLIDYIKEAVKLNEDEVKLPRPAARKPGDKQIETPADLQALLHKNKKAAAAFEAFSYSHRKEYIEWINEAKQEVTRHKRLAATIEQLAEGKSRHWKYQKQK